MWCRTPPPPKTNNNNNNNNTNNLLLTRPTIGYRHFTLAGWGWGGEAPVPKSYWGGSLMSGGGVGMGWEEGQSMF